MKFDIKKVKDILEECEEECDGIKDHLISGQIKEGSAFNSIYYHCNLLIKEKFLDGEVATNIPANTDNHKGFTLKGLTLKGQALLDALENDPGHARKILGFSIRDFSL